jgi:hypothetical protein
MDEASWIFNRADVGGGGLVGSPNCMQQHATVVLLLAHAQCICSHNSIVSRYERQQYTAHLPPLPPDHCALPTADIDECVYYRVSAYQRHTEDRWPLAAS